jgi:hypothetical protein
MVPPFTFINALSTKTSATRIEITRPVHTTFLLAATVCLLEK